MNKLLWEADAEARLQQAPFFIRPLARRKVENAARAQGVQRITLAFVESVKRQEMGR